MGALLICGAGKKCYGYKRDGECANCVLEVGALPEDTKIEPRFGYIFAARDDCPALDISDYQIRPYDEDMTIEEYEGEIGHKRKYTYECRGCVRRCIFSMDIRVPFPRFKCPIGEYEGEIMSDNLVKL